MTADDFRRVALALPHAEESAHMGRPDFRVGGKIFATLGAGAPARGVVKLTRDHQEVVCAAEPTVFSPVKGRWGDQGWTEVAFANADEPTLTGVLRTAWQIVASKKMAAAVERG